MKVKGLRIEEKTKSQQFQIKLLSNLAFAYLHQLDIHAKKYLINYKPETSPAIYALWHGYQWGLGVFPQEDREKLHILISLSIDGEMISNVCHKMGFSLIRGSHKRGGEQAIRDILAETKTSKNIAFMVDGPKGPKQKVKKGIIKIAKMAQVPIIPIVPHTNQKFCFNSWDNYQVPKHLWANVSLIFGEPIYIPKDADDNTIEEYRLKLENELFSLEKQVIEKHKLHWGK